MGNFDVIPCGSHVPTLVPQRIVTHLNESIAILAEAVMLLKREARVSLGLCACGLQCRGRLTSSDQRLTKVRLQRRHCHAVEYWVAE